MNDLESQLLLACEAGYLLALQLPSDNALRFLNQKTLCLLRDAIAAASGRDDEDVQNEFERHARFLRAESAAMKEKPDMKVSELEGAELDYWVRKALDHPCLPSDFSPSDDWSEGGPIIEREKIDLRELMGAWLACIPGKAHQIDHSPLIAAMRCFVASRFGEVTPDRETT